MISRDTEEEVFAEAKANGKVGIPVVVKDNGEVTRMYTVGDPKTVTSFVMLAHEGDEVSFISFDGNMDREMMEKLLAEAAAEQ